MRTIEGWTKKEQQELERLFDYCDDTVGNMGAMYAMYLIIRGPEEFHSITLYGMWHDSTDTTMAQDIIDFWNGEAEFPEKKYNIIFPFNKSFPFLYFDNANFFGFCGTELPNFHHPKKYEFTMQEIKDIDERLVPFAVEVDDEQ